MQVYHDFTVIVEHKLKLERSLEEEKHEHLKTKEDLNAVIQDEKQLRDKQNVDSMNRYNELERNHEVLQVEYSFITCVNIINNIVSKVQFSFDYKCQFNNLLLIYCMYYTSMFTYLEQFMYQVLFVVKKIILLVIKYEIIVVFL